MGPVFNRRNVRKEFPDNTGKVSETDTSLLLSGLVTDVFEYDFGAGTPGPLIRHTNTTYNTLTANIFYDPSQPTVSYPSTIYNRPATVTVSDGSGTTQSQTQYFYDETTPTSTTGTPQHVNVTGSRGNLTTVKKLVSGTTTIQKTTAYFDTGTIKTDNDFNANATTYAYGANSCGNAFPTTITDPAGLPETIVWDCNGGVKTSVTDPNGQRTSYKYTDPNYWRLTETDFPDGGQVNTTYNLGTNRPWNVVQTTKQTSTQNVVHTTVYDTLARVSQQQLTSDPEGTDLTDTRYDAAGHVASVSNPYRSTSDSTYGLTFYAYDGLGRVTTQQQPDGSSIVTQYNANCTTVTDEGGHTRKSCTDGLGRLIEVDEPGAGATLAKTGSGGIGISGSQDQSGTFNVCPGNPNGPCEQTIPDSGEIFITIGGFQVDTTYGPQGPGSTAGGIASALATALNATGSPVSASANGSSITLKARNTGAGSNLAWNASVTWDTHFAAPSFSPCGTASSCSGSLSGGADATFGSAPLVTLYQYDTLGNLICAVQKGTDTTAFTTCAAAPTTWRPRSFTYDSLSRLLSATNPESGTISYTYDNNGNVLTKTSPKPGQTGTSTVVTNYSYDALNRLTKKTYTNFTMPVVQYGYDGVALTGCNVGPFNITSPTNLKGHRTEMCVGPTTSVWSYDPMGRVAQENTKDLNSTNGTPSKSIIYKYYLDGELKTLTYPSGDVVTYTASAAGRTTGVTDASNNYVAAPSTAPMYTPSGLLVGMKNGTAIATQNGYNNRLQPVTLSADTSAATFMSLSYDFHSGNGDNGNVFQIVNNLDSSRSAVFQYDALNRIQQANTVTTTGANCWGEVYTIDNWGNLTNRSGPSGMTGCATEPLNAAPASVKNQLTGLTYDAAGNVTNDGSHTATYDAESRIVADAGVNYSYDADGQRIEKSNGTFYWYGASGEVLAESDLSGNINEEYIFFNGARLARVDRPSGTVHYYFSDHLGSASVITDAAGNVGEQYFYYPYGGMVAQIGSDSNHYKFTGKERDAESGLDNFGARYDSSNLGRFMTPDYSDEHDPVPYANFEDPQTLNLYAYSENNPTSWSDLDGHETGDNGAAPAGKCGFFASLFGLCGGGGNQPQKPPDSNKNPLLPHSFGLDQHNGPTELEYRAAYVSQMGVPYAMQLAHFDEWAARANPIFESFLFVFAGASGEPEVEGSELTAEGAEEFGMLRQAASEKGNFSMGSADAATAERMGRAWVGDGARVASDGKTMVSKDGLRIYRPPSAKPRLGGRRQANFERKDYAGGQPVANGHLDIQ